MSFLDVRYPPEESSKVISKPSISSPTITKAGQQVIELEADIKRYVEQLREVKIEKIKIQEQNRNLVEQLEAALKFDVTSATALLDLVRDYLHSHPEDPRVQKALRHLPTNPEWEGKLGTKGGGWSGPWKDFAALLELALKAQEAEEE